MIYYKTPLHLNAVVERQHGRSIENALKALSSPTYSTPSVNYPLQIERVNDLFIKPLFQKLIEMISREYYHEDGSSRQYKKDQSDDH